jgi:hypothetical protein
VAGLREGTGQLHDTAWYSQRFDVVALSEIWSTGTQRRPLPEHDVFTSPARRAGLRGEGLLVAVRRQAACTAQLWAMDASTLWVRVTPAAAADQPLLVGACYIPLAGSRQLERCTLEERYASLAERVAAAEAEGAVTLAGNCNARMGDSSAARRAPAAPTRTGAT